MAYFGKEFKFDREENFDSFVSSLASSDKSTSKFFNSKPNTKLVKNGDEYTITLTAGDFKKEISFKAGVPFTETISNGLTPTSVVTVNGDTFTQVQDYGDKGKLTITREFSPDLLKVGISTSKWDGVAYRYYVPV